MVERTRTTTLGDVAQRTGTEVPDHLVAQAEVPVASRVIQGDVMVIPFSGRVSRKGHRPLPPEGVNVVESDEERNRHVLSSDRGSGVVYVPGVVADRSRDLGLLIVPKGQIAVLTHTGEHGSVAVGEGTYRVLGQLDPRSRRRNTD